MVGESLVPAVIPILRMLGVEDEVRAYSVYKPGATFVVDREFTIQISFDEVCSRIPRYAYNVPRDRFDATLRAVCERSGARIVEASARVEIVPGSVAEPGGPRVRLGAESLAAASDCLGGAPDWIVDASGRSRLLARLLELPSYGQERRDMALFAHCEGVVLDHPGHVHSDRLEHGWCWRIPLPGRVSLGIVADPAVFRSLGEKRRGSVRRLPARGSASEADVRGRPAPHAGGALRQLPAHHAARRRKRLGAGGRRLRLHRPGLLERSLSRDGRRPPARAGDRRRHARGAALAISAGTCATSRPGAAPSVTSTTAASSRSSGSATRRKQRWLGRLIDRHAARHVAGIFTGEATTDWYSRWVTEFLMTHALGEQDLALIRIA